jgi:hypothetical protein
MPELKKLKKKSKYSAIAIIVVAILLLYFLSYYVVNGFSANDLFFNTHDDVRLMRDGPADGKEYYHYDNVYIHGRMLGGVPEVVYVWNERYNVPVVCTLSATTFHINIPAESFSRGVHSMAIQGKTTDGRWTPIIRFTINKLDTGPDFMHDFLGIENNRVENLLPGVIGGLFRPVEDIVKGIVVVITGGTAVDDLDGDNIPDELQQSPFTPRHNQMNLPLMSAIVFGLIILVILVIIFVIIKPHFDHKRRLQKKPGYFDYKLREKAIGAEKMKQELREERIKRQRLEKEMEKERKQQRKPVNIYMDGHEKKKTAAKTAKISEDKGTQRIQIMPYNEEKKPKSKGLLGRLRRRK